MSNVSSWTPAATRRTRKMNAAEDLAALQALLHDTLDFDKDTPLELALFHSGVTSVSALVDIGPSVVANLEVPEDPKDMSQGKYKLLAGHKIPLTNFKSNHLPTQSDAISQLTNDDYDEFRTSPAFITYRTDILTPPSKQPPVRPKISPAIAPAVFTSSSTDDGEQMTRRMTSSSVEADETACSASQDTSTNGEDSSPGLNSFVKVSSDTGQLSVATRPFA